MPPAGPQVSGCPSPTRGGGNGGIDSGRGFRAMSLQEPGTLWAHSQAATLAQTQRDSRLEGTLDLRITDANGGGATESGRAFAAGRWEPRFCTLGGGELRVEAAVGSGDELSDSLGLGGGGLGGGPGARSCACT